jgi:hypothetical protein
MPGTTLCIDKSLSNRDFDFGRHIVKLSNIGPVKLCLALVMLSAVSVVIAESGSPPPLVVGHGVKDVKTPEFKDYEYGMPLDIAKVISTEYFPPQKILCGVIPAAMTYEDSKGEKHAIRYLYPETSGCDN